MTVESNECFEKSTDLITTVVSTVKVDKELGALRLMVPHDNKEELIRMGAVSIVAAFEAFAYDSMRLSFDLGFSKMVTVPKDKFIIWLREQEPKEKVTTYQKSTFSFYKKVYKRLSLPSDPAWTTDTPDESTLIADAPGKIFDSLSKDPCKKDTVTVMQTVLRKTGREKVRKSTHECD